jgi:hypothetical protein
VPTATGSSLGQTYGDWVAPKSDGDLLIWPDAPTLPDVARDNRRLLDAADHVSFLGHLLPELRRDMRGFLGVTDDSGPLVMTGHQSELHHPGVWVKNVIIHHVARAVGGEAWHVAVDTDSPKHLTLKWPGFKGKISDDPRLHGVAWAGLLDPPTPEHLEHLEAAAVDLPLMAEFLADVRRYLIDQRDSPSPMTLAGAMLDATHKLDWSLGLRYATALSSGLFESLPWLTMALSIAQDADEFARHYNAALAENRHANGITDPDRPMPDLATEDGVEIPFWLDDLRQGRRRRAVVRDGRLLSHDDGETLELPDEPAALLMQLRRRGLRISSRALSLTLFLRLIASDLFVHGVGGGHYDQVLDAIFKSYLKLDPPTFVVATATLHHPDAGIAERVCPRCLKETEHRLRHDVLGDEKAMWLRKINGATTIRERREAFAEYQDRRHAALATDTRFRQFLRHRDEQLDLADRQAILFNRELFFPIQTERRLRDLIARVEAAAAR